MVQEAQKLLTICTSYEVGLAMEGKRKKLLKPVVTGQVCAKKDKYLHHVYNFTILGASMRDGCLTSPTVTSCPCTRS